ncbi:MAG: tetratricopeptide repeat protein, partial [Verrucomicrobiota bacterium]
MGGVLKYVLWLVPATLLAATPDVSTLVRQGIAEQVAGRNRDAVTTLERAVALAEKSGDQSLLLLAKSSLGAVCTCSRQADQAEKNLRESLALADQLHNTNIAAVVQTNLGNLLAAQGKLDDALAAFAAAGTATAKANAAAVAQRAGRAADAEQFNAAALAQLTSQPVTDETALVWLRCGTTDLKLNEFARAEHAFRQAIANATPRVQTYALGGLGQVRELQKKFALALEFTRQAAFIAQANDLPEALYRWEWQTGRLLTATGQRAQAIAAYRRAVQTLQPIRAALTTGCGAARPSFREAVAPVYYELADLLLQDDDREDEAPAEPSLGTARREARPPTAGALAEARNTIEQLKAAELDDYLQDECAATPRAQAAAQKVAKHTAIIHIIPLADRTELLLEFTTGLERVR